MMSNKDVVDALNGLIETTRDGQKGFRECADEADSPELKALFARAATRCTEGLADLDRMVRQYGGEPEDSGSVSAALHRGWMELRTALTSNDDKAVLQECERGEHSALKNYREVLDQGLPDDVRALVQEQYEGVRQNHDHIKALRDSMH